MLKKRLIILVLCGVILSLSACGNTETPPPEDTGGKIRDVTIPEASGATTNELEISPEPSAPEPEASETQSAPPAAENPATSAPANSAASGRPANPPPSQAPSQPTPPATSNPPPTSNPPTQSPATSAPAIPSQAAEPAYTQSDHQRIIDTIREYGETKGFVWNDSFVFGQAGLYYYGRPNLERDGYDGVINRLKYHCDEMAKDIGTCYFKVVKHIYKGNTEFVVLYL